MFAALRALRHRRFAFLWAGQTLSRIGDFVYEIVIAWWVLKETGSAAVMSTVLIVTFLPIALFTLVGGVVVDRVSRPWLMLVSDLLRAGAVLGVAGLAAAGRLEIWMVYALGLLFGIADAFFNPAYFALVPELVPKEDLTSANALTSLSYQLGRVVGPALGGLIVAAGGTVLGLTINGISFVVGALLLLPLLPGARAPRRDPERTESHWRQDLREGFDTVRAQPILITGLLLGALAAACLVGPFLVSMPFMIGERFGADPRVYGFLLACFPIGFVLGGLWGGRLTGLPRRGLVYFGGMGIAAVALSLFGLSLPLAALAILALVNGFSLELAGMAWTLLQQEHVPAEQLGRVASLDQLLGWSLTPVAFAVAGWTTQHWGAGLTFVLGGGAAAFICLAALLNPAVLATE